MGHHCKDCFDALTSNLFERTIVATAFQDKKSGDIEVLRVGLLVSLFPIANGQQEYACRCGARADLSRGAQCKPCLDPCKPLPLNDPASAHLFRVNSGEEGTCQREARAATAIAAAQSGSMGWTNASTYVYLRDESMICARQMVSLIFPLGAVIFSLILSNIEILVG